MQNAGVEPGHDAARDAAADRASADASRQAEEFVDAVIVGAGFAGLYLLHRLRQLGFSTRTFEAASDVGGTWFWNRYPGARCDIATTDYTFTFDAGLEADWTWSEKFATQPEILRYAQFVADRLDLRRSIDFETRIRGASWDEASSTWTVHTDRFGDVRCRFLLMASGMLSVPKEPDLANLHRFAGRTLLTGRWPHEPVDLTGQRVVVVGTGSSGVQVIPEVARQAASVTVLQRTPVFAIPARNGPQPPARVEWLRRDRESYRTAARTTRTGVPRTSPEVFGRALTPEKRHARIEEAWATGELTENWGAFMDMMSHEATNEAMAEFIREHIRNVVRDPVTADRLCPTGYPFGAKRPCLESGYYEAFKLAHVRLIDLKSTPISTVTETGIELASGKVLACDTLILATGYDAITGALVAIDIVNREGHTLAQRWREGASSYLGLMVEGFPNLFTVTGPGAPAALTNVMASIEHHVEWLSECLTDLRARGIERIEPTRTAQDGWVQHCADWAALTLFPRADSWYMGANVPGKPRVFMSYLGGLAAYRQICSEVLSRDHLGFRLSGGGREKCHDGVIRRLQPDVEQVLNAVAALNLPALNTLSPEGARALRAQMTAQRPPGPNVAHIQDGELPTRDGHRIGWRLYRPEASAALPLIVYFHGGGWLLGDLGSDDPLCRDLCVRTGCALLSINYRHAPEWRFPTPVNDAEDGLLWALANGEALGVDTGKTLVAGWSAGANLATVVARRLRDAGNTALRGQVLITPVTDADFGRASYVENAEGFGLTADLMRWFWSHYADEADRQHPDASPLRESRLAALPPAVIVTCEFDPLREEGDEYARALNRAGVPVQHVQVRGQTHLSLTMVDVIASGEPIRASISAQMGELLQV